MKMHISFVRTYTQLLNIPSKCTMHRCGTKTNLVKLLEYKSVPLLNEFPQVGTHLLLLSADEQTQGTHVFESPEGPQEVGGLTVPPLCPVQHPKQEAQLASKAQLPGTQVVLHATAGGLQEVEDLQ